MKRNSDNSRQHQQRSPKSNVLDLRWLNSSCNRERSIHSASTKFTSINQLSASWKVASV